MAKIHHETVKRAARLGVELLEIPTADGIAFRAVRIEDQALSILAESAKLLLDAIANGEANFEKAQSFKGMKSGVMVMHYHVKYTLNGGGCGDTLDQALRDLLVTEEGTNLDLLRQVAEANGVWVQKWASLNPGMQRMNLANRLRAILRNDPNESISLFDEGTGRFDIEYEPSKKQMRAISRAKAQAAKDQAKWEVANAEATTQDETTEA